MNGDLLGFGTSYAEVSADTGADASGRSSDQIGTHVPFRDDPVPEPPSAATMDFLSGSPVKTKAVHAATDFLAGGDNNLLDFAQPAPQAQDAQFEQTNLLDFGASVPSNQAGINTADLLAPVPSEAADPFTSQPVHSMDSQAFNPPSSDPFAQSDAPVALFHPQEFPPLHTSAEPSADPFAPSAAPLQSDPFAAFSSVPPQPSTIVSTPPIVVPSSTMPVTAQETEDSKTIRNLPTPVTLNTPCAGAPNQDAAPRLMTIPSPEKAMVKPAASFSSVGEDLLSMASAPITSVSTSLPTDQELDGLPVRMDQDKKDPDEPEAALHPPPVAVIGAQGIVTSESDSATKLNEPAKTGSQRPAETESASLDKQSNDEKANSSGGSKTQQHTIPPGKRQVEERLAGTTQLAGLPAGSIVESLVLPHEENLEEPSGNLESSQVEDKEKEDSKTDDGPVKVKEETNMEETEGGSKMEIAGSGNEAARQSAADDVSAAPCVKASSSPNQTSSLEKAVEDGKTSKEALEDGAVINPAHQESYVATPPIDETSRDVDKDKKTETPAGTTNADDTGKGEASGLESLENNAAGGGRPELTSDTLEQKETSVATVSWLSATPQENGNKKIEKAEKSAAEEPTGDLCGDSPTELSKPQSSGPTTENVNAVRRKADETRLETPEGKMPGSRTSGGSEDVENQDTGDETALSSASEPLENEDDRFETDKKWRTKKVGGQQPGEGLVDLQQTPVPPEAQKEGDLTMRPVDSAAQVDTSEKERRDANEVEVLPANTEEGTEGAASTATTLESSSPAGGVGSDKVLEQRVESLERQLSAAQALIAELEYNEAEKKHENDEVLAELQTNLQKQMTMRAEAEDAARRATAKATTLEEEFAVYKKETAFQIESLSEDLSTAVTENSGMKAEVEQIRNERDEQARNEASLTNRLNAAKVKEGEQAHAAEIFENRTDQLQNELTQTTEKLTTVTAERDCLKKDVANWKQFAEEKTQKLDSALKSERKQNDQRKKKMKVFVEAKTEEVRVAKADNISLQTELDQTNQSLKELNQRFKQLHAQWVESQTRCRELQRDISRMKNDSEKMSKVGGTLEAKLSRSAMEMEDHKNKRLAAKNELMAMLRQLEAEKEVSNRLRDSIKVSFTTKALSQQQTMSDALDAFEGALQRLALRLSRPVPPRSTETVKEQSRDDGSYAEQENAATAGISDASTKLVLTKLENETQRVSDYVVSFAENVDRMNVLVDGSTSRGCVDALQKLFPSRRSQISSSEERTAMAGLRRSRGPKYGQVPANAELT